MKCTVAAVGTANALGSRLPDVWSRLQAGDAARLERLPHIVPGREIWFGGIHEALPAVPSVPIRHVSRNNALALAALQEIEPAVRSAIDRVGAARFGVVIGTSTSGVAEAEAAIRTHRETGSLPPSFHFGQFEHGSVARFLAEHLGARGPHYTVSTACSSSAKALASGRSLLTLGLCDAVLAGGADSLCALTTNGFAALHALSPTPTNPMSRNRDGLTLGEGAALFLLTREPGEIALLGVGESSDAHHISAPDPEGRGAETAMRHALRDAAVDARDVHYLNLHGTGTPQNDLMESHAVSRVFGDDIPCSSTKPLVGHALGAASALEAAFCWLSLVHASAGTLTPPPHVFDGARDPALAPIALAQVGDTIPVPARVLVASNSFGFGGSNCTLVFGRDA